MKNAHNINDRFTGSEAAPEGAVRPSFPLIDTSAGTFPGPAPPTPSATTGPVGDSDY